MKDERFTYAHFRIYDIKRKLLSINPEMKEPRDVEVLNLALIVFSMICDAHVNADLERHEIVEDMLDNVHDFKFYASDLIEQSNETNQALNDYLDKEINLNNGGMK